MTPTSQIVGVQSMLNVKFGRWKNITPQAADIALGYYGAGPGGPGSAEALLRKNGQGTDHLPPADLIKPGMEDPAQELAEKGLPTDDEHCVSDLRHVPAAGGRLLQEAGTEGRSPCRWTLRVAPVALRLPMTVVKPTASPPR